MSALHPHFLWMTGAPMALFSTPSGIAMSLRAERSQVCRLISTQFGSSNEPPENERRPGRNSAVCVMIVPQFVQNCRRIQRPDSAERCSHALRVPVPPMRVLPSSNQAATINALPVRRWQTLQCQAAARTGWPVAEYRPAPQRQPPVWTSLFILPPLPDQEAIIARTRNRRPFSSYLV